MQRRSTAAMAHSAHRPVPANAPSNPIEPLDAKDTGDFLDASEDAFELLAVIDLQRDIDARVKLVRAALEHLDIRAGTADHPSDISQHAGPVFRADQQADREGGLGRARPFDANTPLGLVEKVLHVGTGGAVHRDTAGARGIDDDLISGGGTSALWAIHQSTRWAAQP